ncbi:uncharacterized protein LOC131336113 [Rhododendron vialii]|uniref:uncharacterized protein LOC131336113 n=1 Tax=Rhododendron vialii TaxID=182163 RepID=UPI00265DF49D|nr:uncharacterized protein LOC131336113 [Rhododendron vialii]
MGLSTKNGKTPSFRLDYLIEVQEVKPWPPSQSLRTLRSVLLQWEYSDRKSGSTNPVVPSLGSGTIGDGKIEFNTSFRLSMTQLRQTSTKGGERESYKKNCLEFNLYECRMDKTVKGQSLGTAIVDLADYGVVKETLNVCIPMNSKRSFSNTSQPALFIKIQSIKKGGTNSSSRENLSKESSTERNGGESVSALTNEEYAEGTESTSISDDDDDDVSSHSSLAVSSSGFETNVAFSLDSEETVLQTLKDSSGKTYDKHRSASEPEQSCEISEVPPSCPSSTDLSPKTSLTLMPEKIATHSGQSSSSSITCEGAEEEVNTNLKIEGSDRKEHQENGQVQMLHEGQDYEEDEPWKRFSDVAKNVNTLRSDRLKHVKSVRSPMDSVMSNGSVRSSKLGDTQNGAQGFVSSERNDAKVYPVEARNIASDGRIEQLEHRIKMLEGELREAAAIEVGLYSVVAEHGSSINKVHAPARRLARLYLHACKESSQSRRASAARSVVSGLVLVAKACGNDVPRLTFWLSNSVVLRAIISQAIAEQQLPISAAPCVEINDGGKGYAKKLSPLKWKEFSLSKECGSLDGWEDPHKLTSALEKTEAWIFSRIIESVWWQTLTPHMQSAAAKAISARVASDVSRTYRRTSSSADEEQVNFSLDLWKKAFKDACERLCPVRAGGHECGCLPLLARMIMEQCVARLDVAMFNAILRESDDELPTDPVSDPISDAKVLPIPAGKASFGAGAQLKNAIGNWSRWLTDLFGIEDDDSIENMNNENGKDIEVERKELDTSFKAFHLLNALSDLMMLPKDMLLSRSIRKEVCPTFGAPLIKRVLINFLPDEFCPDPIPDALLEALDSEDEAEEGSVPHFPCNAAPIVYLPPPLASVAGIIGQTGIKSPELRRNGSSVLKKSHTSDDELDELDSPLTAIIETLKGPPTPKEHGSQNSVRYQLLREVWTNTE